MVDDRNLTVVTAVNPIVTKIHADCGDAPGPSRVPWQAPQMISLVDHDVRVILSAAEQDPATLVEQPMGQRRHLIVQTKFLFLRGQYHLLQHDQYEER